MNARRPVGTLCLQVAAKILASRGIETGGRRIFEQLRELGLIEGRHATAEAINKGLLVEELGEFEYGSGSGQDVYTRVFLTRAGLGYVAAALTRRAWRPDCDMHFNECKLGF